MKTHENCGQPVLELTEGQREPIAFSRRQMALFGQGTWGAGWLELRQQIKVFIGFRAASPAILRQGILSVAPVITEISLQPVYSGNPTRA